MSKYIRTFIAVEVSDDVQQQAGELIARLKQSQPDVKWVTPEEMHITLHFLGEVPILQTREICEAVDTALAGLPKFEITLGTLGAFPRMDHPRTLWMGITHGVEPLLQLHDRLANPLLDLGLRLERRRYHPHLTLGRVRGDDESLPELLQQEMAATAGTCEVREVVVFSSELSPEGSIYRPLGRTLLKRAK